MLFSPLSTLVSLSIWPSVLSSAQQMLDKEPATLKNLIASADFKLELPQNCLKFRDEIAVSRNYLEIPSHNVFYLRTDPPEGNRVLGNLLFLHDQINTSSVWESIGSLKVCTFNARKIMVYRPSLRSVTPASLPTYRTMERRPPSHIQMDPVNHLMVLRNHLHSPWNLLNQTSSRLSSMPWRSTRSS